MSAFRRDVSVLEFGRELRTEREQCGLTPGDAAQVLRLNVPLLGWIESGRRRLQRDQFEHMLERYAIVWEGRP